MTRLLNCIISYNRFHYLRNAVDSVREYLRFGDLCVFDDGSDDPVLMHYLQQLSDSGVIVVRKERRFHHGYHGGLYELMNEAIDHALSQHYDLLNFIQDDVQFLWHDPELLVKVMKIFKTHDIVATAWGNREFKLNRSFFCRNLNTLNFLDFLHT